ncbi:MAG: AAA family ATPase [Cyanobacteriota bacterium]|nr:AAA family ATPase [Cyanobacteriota bacterium]
MNAEEAFNLFNELEITKNNTGLGQLEKDIFIGTWEGQTYPQIEARTNWALQTLKEAGTKLFKKIDASWNININKKNFKLTIEHLLRQHLEAKENLTLQQLAATQVDRLPIVNPFFPLTGKLDNPQLFFNRDKEKRRIFEILNSGSSVALIGERQIGKSSLLLAIRQQAESQLTTPRQGIYLDLQNIRDEDDFYGALCHAINIETTKGYFLERSLQKHRLLLLLDEVEKMTWDGFTNNIRSELRGLAEGSNAPLRLVVAARSSLDILFPDSEGMTSPFANICIEEKIGRWNEDTMRGFISSRLNSPLLKPEAKGVNFTEEEIARVMEESGGHPQKLMQLCHGLYANYLEE